MRGSEKDSDPVRVRRRTRSTTSGAHRSRCGDSARPAPGACRPSQLEPARLGGIDPMYRDARRGANGASGGVRRRRAMFRDAMYRANFPKQERH